MPGACHSNQQRLLKSDIGMKNKKSLKKTWKRPELKSLKFNQTLGGKNTGFPEGGFYDGSQ